MPRLRCHDIPLLALIPIRWYWQINRVKFKSPRNCFRSGFFSRMHAKYGWLYWKILSAGFYFAEIAYLIYWNALIQWYIGKMIAWSRKLWGTVMWCWFCCILCCLSILSSAIYKINPILDCVQFIWERIITSCYCTLAPGNPICFLVPNLHIYCMHKTYRNSQTKWRKTKYI